MRLPLHWNITVNLRLLWVAFPLKIERRKEKKKDNIRQRHTGKKHRQMGLENECDSSTASSTRNQNWRERERVFSFSLLLKVQNKPIEKIVDTIAQVDKRTRHKKNNPSVCLSWKFEQSGRSTSHKPQPQQQQQAITRKGNGTVEQRERQREGGKSVMASNTTPRCDVQDDQEQLFASFSLTPIILHLPFPFQPPKFMSQRESDFFVA